VQICILSHFVVRICILSHFVVRIYILSHFVVRICILSHFVVQICILSQHSLLLHGPPIAPKNKKPLPKKILVIYCLWGVDLYFHTLRIVEYESAFCPPIIFSHSPGLVRYSLTLLPSYCIFTPSAFCPPIIFSHPACCAIFLTPCVFCNRRAEGAEPLLCWP